MRGNFTMKFYIVTAPLKSHTWKENIHHGRFYTAHPSAGSGIVSCWLENWGHRSRSVCFPVILDLTGLSSKITDQHTKDRKILPVKSIGGIITSKQTCSLHTTHTQHRFILTRDWWKPHYPFHWINVGLHWHRKRNRSSRALQTIELLRINASCKWTLPLHPQMHTLSPNRIQCNPFSATTSFAHKKMLS